jgi:hypothetical protein
VAQDFPVESSYLDGREKIVVDEEFPYELCGIKWG